MTRFGWLMVGCALLLIVAAFAAFRFSATRRAQAPVPSVSTTTPAVDPNSTAIYTNGQYGFSLFYPAADTLQASFAATSTAPWRVNASATGTPVVWVTDPAGQVRIGASTATKDLKTCTQPAPAEYPLPALAEGTTTWSAFTFDRVGTDDEVRVTSFRTMHEHACIALEVLEPLAQAQAAGTTSPALMRIVQGFRFARP